MQNYARLGHMAEIIDGKKIANNILENVKKEVTQLKKQGISPRLAVVLVGEHKPSQTYVKKKEQAAKKVGMEFELHKYPADIGKKELVEEIKIIQEDEQLCGLIVQLPLPEPLYTPEVLNAVKPELDVDCLTDVNLGKLVTRTGYILPPTPGAVNAVIKNLGIDVKGKNITILGAGALVGKPLSIILLNKQASVVVCNSLTKDVKKKCKQADIIVTAVGKKDLLTSNMVKKGAVVIDTGICFEDGKMYGDVNFESVSKKASHITPVPGGIGPITVSLLLKNTITLTKQGMS